MGETVKTWKEYVPLGYLPLAHPSPRNQPWFAKNPWFEEELVQELQLGMIERGHVLPCQHQSHRTVLRL